jgi:enediyne biosynthesis protein E4
MPPLLRYACVLACVANFGCEKTSAPQPPGIVAVSPFRDVAEEAGLIFRHENGMIGKRYILEIIGSGSALLDYDRDGDLDLFLVQGRSLDRDPNAPDAEQPVHRLFRNDSFPADGGPPLLQFTDVTEEAGLSFSDYGMGAIAGDYDRDGNMDLYLTCYGHDRLLRNNGQKRFVDVTESAGLKAASAWSTSASWADFDRDGHLDLFVCQYLDWTFETHVSCPVPWGGVGYCGPQTFPPSRSRLYRNQGDGTFRDVSQSSRIAEERGAALGVVGADIDDDGWIDFFVANDAMPNHLWINRHDGTFAEEARSRGCALSAEGMPEGNMGIIAADFFNQGRTDLFITHLKGEPAVFFRNQGDGQFTDVTADLGLDAPTRTSTGFGTGAIDYDNDGALDIFAANGGVQVEFAQEKKGIPLPLRQRSLLFHNRGRLEPVFEMIVGFPFLELAEVGRGVAFGDLDNDGDTDMIVNNNHGPVRLLRNEVGQQKHWLGLSLVAGPPGAEFHAIGAVARLERPGWPMSTRRCATDGSYLASSDPRLLFGLGDSPDTGKVRVRWPDGSEHVWENLPCDRYHLLHQDGISGVPPTSKESALRSTAPLRP